MKNTIENLTRKLGSGLLGGVFALVTGSAAGQALTLISAPLLARLYTPESFGIFSYLFSVCAVLTAIASLRLDVAVPLAHELDEARALTRTSLRLATGFALVTALVVAQFHAELSDLAGFEILPWAYCCLLYTSDAADD